MVRHRPIQGESNINFLGESEGSLPQPQDSLPDAGEAMNDFWSMSGNFIYRHHVEPRVKLYSPREESFPIPLKYIDVSRTTDTNLDVKQEKRIDDYWNIDGSRDLSDPWTGFTQFTLLEEKPPDGYMWSGERLTRKQLTSRPDHPWPELWKSMGKHAKLKEKQKWSNEKLHLENARKLRGIYFIDPEDKEFKETIKNARKQLETSVAPAMPCKIMKNCGSDGSNKIKTKLACILEADESTRLRMGDSLPNHHEDHIAGRGENSLQHYNLVHKFIPMPQAMKIPAAKAAVDKEWEKLEKFSAWNLTKVRSCLAAGGGAKRIYQYCTDISRIIVYLRALQGHSGRNLIDPSLQDNVVIQSGFFQHIYHIECAFNLHSIINNGLIPGGQNSSKRQTGFFFAY